MWIVEFSDYKAFVRATLRTFPNNGRGQSQKLADHLRVSPMVISHILTRERHFSPDQALEVASYFGLDEKGSEYFLNLVNLARSDTTALKKYYEAKLLRIREDAQNIKNLVAGREELTDEDKGIFYSNWFYCAIWLATSLDGLHTVDALAAHFRLSRRKTGEIISFLLSRGLCTQKSGHIHMAIKSTHVGDQSSFVNNHRRNWRDKAREKFPEPSKGDFFYSSPMSLSKKDAEKFRKEILSLIKTFSEQVVNSPEERLMCLNIDWFEF